MIRKPLIGLVVLWCVALGHACTNQDGSIAVGNTEIDLVLESPGGGQRLEVDAVQYRITCLGTSPDADPIELSGSFEVDGAADPPVWETVTDLPPTFCTMNLLVYDGGRVVCSGSDSLDVSDNGDPSSTNEFNVVLLCNLSSDKPSGRVRVDGTFDVVVGNVCPSLVWFNAIPSVVDVADVPQATDVQYRAFDHGSTCGDNCDPQVCDDAIPRTCVPSPFNPADPRCNPLVGGDPNDAECTNGTASGLVCTLTATSAANGALAGDFLDPTDGVSPLGPVVPLNLEDSLGDGSGVVVPGYDIPYLCDPTFPGAVTLSVICSDGDAECDQSMTFEVVCPGINFCAAEPVDVCAGSNDCRSDGVCEPSCDPRCDPTLSPGIPTCPSGSSATDACSQCAGRDNPLPINAQCASGGGSVCDGVGNCVECNADSQCDASPVDCREAAVCAGNVCQPRALSPEGSPCSIGTCDATGVCQFVPTDPPATSLPIALGCTDNLGSDIAIVPFDLSVDPSAIVGNSSVTAWLAGVARVPESVLDRAQAAPGGAEVANIIDVAATVWLRSGGSGVAVALGSEAVPYVCAFDLSTACDPANDDLGTPGERGNTDCVPVDASNPCGRFFDVPTSFNCLTGGTCDQLGKLDQCATNGFCVTGPLELPLAAASASYLADSSGTLLFGWDDVSTGATLNPDSTWALPSAEFLAPLGPNGVRLHVGGLSTAIECTMAVDADDPLHGVGVSGAASPSPDSLLLGFPIEVP